MNDSKLYDSLLELVIKRRTIRRFRSDPVPDEYIRKIIEVARWAPSGFHTQPWEFVVIKDRKIRSKIISIMEHHGSPIKNETVDNTTQGSPEPSFRDAPVFILLLGDWRAKVGLPQRAQENDTVVANLFCSSLANTFLYMHLAATSLGLASQWYTATARPEAEQRIKDIVGIPEALSIYDMMVLGYAYSPPLPKIVRDFDDMVHYDNCGVHDFRTNEEVAAYARTTWEWCMKAH